MPNGLLLYPNFIFVIERPEGVILKELLEPNERVETTGAIRAIDLATGYEPKSVQHQPCHGISMNDPCGKHRRRFGRLHKRERMSERDGMVGDQSSYISVQAQASAEMGAYEHFRSRGSPWLETSQLKEATIPILIVEQRVWISRIAWGNF